MVNPESIRALPAQRPLAQLRLETRTLPARPATQVSPTTRASLSAQSSPTPDFDKLRHSRSSLAARKRTDLLMRVLLYAARLIAVIPLISVLSTRLLMVRAFDWYFHTHNMRGVGGLYPFGRSSRNYWRLAVLWGPLFISVSVGIMTTVYMVELFPLRNAYIKTNFFLCGRDKRYSVDCGGFVCLPRYVGLLFGREQ